MSMGISASTVDYLFSSTVSRYSQESMDSLAGTVLSKAIDYYQDENYDEAIKCFRNVIGLSPTSDNAFDAYTYMGEAYTALEDTDGAIKTYKEAISVFKGDSEADTFYTALGDIYLQDGQWEEAVTAYEGAIAIDPNDSESQYSLGECYFELGNLDKAYEHFKRVTQISPDDPAGYYGLGEVARSEGDYSYAVSLFKKSISLDSDFELAYRDLGYTYVDMKDYISANDQLSVLEDKDSDYVSDLEAYIPSEISSAESTKNSLAPTAFSYYANAGTEVSSLSSDLSEADSTELFSMTFYFTKAMDEYSVVDPTNWTISRAMLESNYGVYNNGKTVTSSEALIDRKPTLVKWDESSNSATVYFRISQNEDADATIDPEHIVFKFSGVDAYGKVMNTSADEYAGFSGIA